MATALCASPLAHIQVAQVVDFLTGSDTPEVSAVRVGLSALVLLLALTVAPRLAGLLTMAPRHADESPAVEGSADMTPQVVETGGGASRCLRDVTLGSMWLAAVTAVAVIWLWGRSGFLPDSPRVLLTQAGYVLTRVAISLLVLAVALALGHALDTGMELALERARVNKNLLVLAGHAIYTATVLIGLIVILSVWGVSLVVPVTVIGVITVALSVALQDVLKNVVCGVYLLIERPFMIGDEIAVAPPSSATYAGIIEDIQIRVTHLRTPDGQLALVPNATLFTTAVVNKSAYRRRRVALAVSVPLAHVETGTDGARKGHGAEGAEKQILSALRATEGVRTEPSPEVTLTGFAAGRCDLRVTFWVPTGDPRRESGIVSAAIEHLRLRLPGAEITPQRGPVGGTPVTV